MPRTVAITGSSSGIGWAIACAFAKKHFSIGLHGLEGKEHLLAQKDQLLALGAEKVASSGLDLSQASAARRTMESFSEVLGSIDVLINNAGVQYTAKVEDFPIEKWNLIMQVNLTAAFDATASCLPAMKKNNFGRLIHIASAHGLVGSVNKSAYVASKHALMGLSKVIALECAEFNITSNCICPGWVKTPLVEKQIADRAKASSLTTQAAERELVMEKQPNGRFADADQIAEACIFLSAESSGAITGSHLSVDGGWTAI